MAPAGRPLASPLHHGVPDVPVAPVPLQTIPFAVDEMESTRGGSPRRPHASARLSRVAEERLYHRQVGALVGSNGAVLEREARVCSLGWCTLGR